MKIGQGYDVHKLLNREDFSKAYPLRDSSYLILAGVQIKHEKLLAGHSDADVLVHAIIDAVLGAAGLGDIGQHFPDNSAEYEGISSLELLRKVYDLITKEGLKVSNLDSTIIAQAPKLASYIPEMRKNIAEVLKIDSKLVNVKATTTEGLGFTGREEGIAAQAICLLS